MKKIVVAMSGGVDSSVAAALLKDQGNTIIGVTMKICDGKSFSVGTNRHGCYGPGEEDDIEDARKVARILGIPFYVFDLSQKYKTQVLDYFCHEYLSGRTPNPCIKCNHQIKFDALVAKARDSGIEFDYFATGHYAQVEYDQTWHRYLLKKGRDSTKDQSYLLFSLSQEQLSYSLFPVGNYTKENVKKMAAYFNLGVEKKPESQDFIAGGYSSLIETAQPGPILDKTGKMLGEHRGVSFYTVGQRKRLDISAKKPLYVTDIDMERNAIIVGTKEELYHDELIASGVNWIAPDRLQQIANLKAKIRYRHQEAEVVVITPLEGDSVYIKFKEPQMAITPGQAIVFYNGDIVVGGGMIERTKS